MAETTDGYYFMNGSFLFYADKSRMQSIPVCDRPDCLHDKETDPTKTYLCNAFLSIPTPTRSFLTIYHNQLYVLSYLDVTTGDTNPKLIKISIDGSKRQTEFIFPPETYAMTMHRGYLYYVERDESNGKTTLRRHKIGKSQKQSELIYTSDIFGANIFDIIAFGNNLYFRESGNIDGEYTNRATHYDLISNEISQIFKKDTQSYCGMPQVIDGKLYCEIWDSLDSKISPTYVSDLKGNNMQQVFTKEMSDTACADDQFFYYGKGEQSQKDESFTHTISISDTKGNEIDSISTNQIHSRYFDFIPGNDRHLFIWFLNEKEMCYYWIDKSKIGSGHLELHELLKQDFQSALPEIQYNATSHP
ncbi:MAG: hypothetical protein ACLSAP_00915 [Oscillospiraceae bacterium]